LEKAGIGARILLTEREGHGQQLVAGASLSDFDGVVAAGGDGTVFEVLNGLYEHDRDRRVPLGLIPMGTGNAFAREFGLSSSDLEKSVTVLASGKSRPVDVGLVRCKDDQFCFLNIAGIGFAVDAGLAAGRLKVFGNAAYTLGTLWRTLQLSSYPLKITLDGERLEQQNVFVEVSNSRYTGTTFLIAPGAQLDDGLLDITLLRKLSRIRLLRLFPTIYSGRHVEFEEVETYQAQHIRIEQPEGMLMAVDGEFRGHTPLEIRCLHRDLQLLV
jgi:YegS/Rv2252/BmrU family lipid kinase